MKENYKNDHPIWNRWQKKHYTAFTLKYKTQTNEQKAFLQDFLAHNAYSPIPGQETNLQLQSNIAPH